MRAAGIPFTAAAAEIDETPLESEAAAQLVLRLARQKAEAVEANADSSGRRGDALRNDSQEEDARKDGQSEVLQVLGADTAVVVDGKVLGKPVDAEDAARMLRLLSGRTHEVLTGVCLITSAGAKRSVETAVVATSVTFATIPERDIAEYIATGEPMDKAGGYAIQGGASRWATSLRGDYSNVVGLPVSVVVAMLEATGGLR